MPGTHLALDLAVNFEEADSGILVPATRRRPLPVDPIVDTSLTAEAVHSKWFPEVVASFNDTGALPPAVHELEKGPNVEVDLSGFQLKVTVPPGESYVLATKRQVHYTNGQETRALGTTVFESPPEAGVTAALWVMSKNRRSGFGSGHSNGEDAFLYRFDGAVDGSDNEVTPRSAWLHDEPLYDERIPGFAVVNYQAPQINRYRMLYLGFGPLVHEARNREVSGFNKWLNQNHKHFINDADRKLPNLSNPNLGMQLEIRNNGTQPCVVRTNSWGIGPVLGDAGEQQPDGDRIYPKADGVAVDVDGNRLEFFGEPAPGQLIPMGPVDTDGHNQIEIYIRTTKTSASNGVRLYPTPNADAQVPIYGPPIPFTVTAEDAENGFALIPVSVAVDGFAFEYEHGPDMPDEGDFWIVITMRKPARPLPQRSMTGTIEKTDAGVVTWARTFGFDDAGNFHSGSMTALGNPRSAIAQQEIELQGKSCSSALHSNATATTAPQRLDTIQLANRKYITIGNADNNTTFFYASTQAAVLSSGIPVGPGMVIQEEWDQNLQFWVYAPSGSASARLSQTAGTV